MSLVKNTGATVFMVQEKSSRRMGKYRFQDYIICDAIRRKVGGGSLMGVHQSLNPKLITLCDEDNYELIVVKTKIGIKETWCWGDFQLSIRRWPGAPAERWQ